MLTKINRGGAGCQGVLYAVYAGILARLGFEPNVQDDPIKVDASWGFMDELGRCAFIWCYCDKKDVCTNWSIYGSFELLKELFGDEYVLSHQEIRSGSRFQVPPYGRNFKDGVAARSKVREALKEYDFSGTIIDDRWVDHVTPEAVNYIENAKVDLSEYDDQGEVIAGVLDAFIVQLVKEYDTEWILAELLNSKKK